MPRSAHSGVGSTQSSNSRHAKTPKYYKVSHTSQVDESLFGSKPKENTRQFSDEITKPKQEIKVITKDLIRTLKVPDQVKKGPSVILSFDEYHMLMRDSTVETEEEIIYKREHEKQKKTHELNEMHDRKLLMKMKDMERIDNEKLNDLEEDEQRKREFLNEYALENKREQDDEIKKLNELILNAKCHAIRKLQTEEKIEVSKEEIEEQRRLDRMMEIERQKAIVMQEEIIRRQKEERLIGKGQVMKQIEENHQKKLIELEKKDQENILQQQYVQKLCEEEREILLQRKMQKAQHSEELREINDKMLRRKEIEKYQDKIESEKMLQYQLEKAEKEKEAEKDKERVRIEKEFEVARLRDLQEREIDKQAEQDELRARRAQEANEREWRKKEIKVAKTKVRIEDELKKARNEQMEQKQHYLAVDGQRERAEFEKVLRTQHEMTEKEKLEALKKKQSQSCYKKELVNQIKSKESERIHQNQEKFMEHSKIKEEAQKRRDELDALKLKKLRALELQGLDPIYTQQVARKANISLKCS